MAIPQFRVIFCLLLTVVAMMGHAAPVSYTIDFSPTGNPATPISGSFVYDAGAQDFSSFTVQQGGRTFDLTAEVNAPSIGAILVPRVCAAGLTSSPAISFQIMSQSLPGCDQYHWLLVTAAGGLARMNFEASSSATGGQDGVLFGGGDGGIPPPTQDFSGSFSITAVPEPGTSVAILL